jgi:hypothetical protein
MWRGIMVFLKLDPQQYTCAKKMIAQCQKKKEEEEKEGDRCALCVKGTSFASES